MQPIGLLMAEHRLIERMIDLIQKEIDRMQAALAGTREIPMVNPAFIDTAVDFIRIYADKTHHGKEEDILFVDCAAKNLAPEHRSLLHELLSEHDIGRQTTRTLLQAKEEYLRGNKEKVDLILYCMGKLVTFYPQHIHKEDHHFFRPSMDYFSQAELDAMLHRMWEYDRKMIHEKYHTVVAKLEV